MKSKILRVIIPLVVAVVIILCSSIPIYSATQDVVVFTNTPQFLSISIAPGTYEINGADGKGAKPNTTYYTNPLGMETAPTAGGATDGECAFTITNLSNVATDLKVTSSDFSTGDDNSTNSNDGTNGATTYGAKSYFSGQATAAWVVAKTSGSSTGYSNLAATTDIKFGMIILEQTDAWTGATPAIFTVTVVASAN
jgi:hypothetical protein